LNAKSVTVWNLDGVLEELAEVNHSMQDRQFAFILGAGASFTSGIPTGHQLAQRWLAQIHRRECMDETTLEDWLAADPPDLKGVSHTEAGTHYSRIFERRFRNDREAGYAALETAMEGKQPSLGYSLLAEIIQHTRHKIVITTNFDNLVADALAMHAHQSPLVVAHESLAGFVRPQLRRPLVAKIHRDLFFSPKNDTSGVSTMEEPWTQALKKVFQYFTPIVVGYGGNDGSLMGMLNNLMPGDIPGRMIWCCRAGSTLPATAEEVLKKHNGIRTDIPGFDEFMLQLAAKLVPDFDIAELASRTAKLGEERAKQYREQADKLQGSLKAKGRSASTARTVKALTPAIKKNSDWWSWLLRARAEADPDRREAVYREALTNLPTNTEILGSYARFLADERKDLDAAEAMYKKALELDPTAAFNTGNYAIFLAQERKDFDAAEAMFKKALELDPSDAFHTGNYANFLADERKDLDAAEAMFKKALELDSTAAFITGNYAIFLAQERKDFDAAEAMFKKALELDPSNALRTGSYANFLADERKDFDAAEAMFKKALELDPTAAFITGNYAIFLAQERKDFDAAEAMFKKALELDPSNAFHTGNYANFLADERKDLDAAEAMYKKALELDPFDVNDLANYAALLLSRRDVLHLEKVNELIKRCVAACDAVPSQALAEALLYGALSYELRVDPSLIDSLPRLKGLLAMGFERGSWDFSRVFEATLPNISEDKHSIYRAIGAAILDANALVELKHLPAWQEVSPKDPFAH
jgi:protein O-mannosyl-transferase